MISVHVFRAFADELVKEARVFGEHEPDVADQEVPYERRKQWLLNYAKKKSAEDKTPWSTALLTGTGVGAGTGALIGALSGAGRGSIGIGKGALLGAATGGVGGGLIGAAMKSSDDSAIARAKRLQRPDTDIEDELARQVIQQKRRREAYQNLNAERRHQELLASNRYRY